MAFTESVSSSTPSTIGSPPLVAPPPPRIRPESPAFNVAEDISDISDVEDNNVMNSDIMSEVSEESDVHLSESISDISDAEVANDLSEVELSKSDISSNPDFMEESDKLEEVSDQELDIDPKDEANLTAELENIESDEDLADLESKPLTCGDHVSCMDCFLTFSTENALMVHLESDRHWKSSEIPSQLDLFCLVCRKDFADFESMDQHVKSLEHLNEITSSQIVAVNGVHVSNILDVSEKSTDEKQSGNEESLTQSDESLTNVSQTLNRDLPDVVPDQQLRQEQHRPAAGTSNYKVCTACNLAFLTANNLKRHLRTKPHLAASKGRRPPAIGRRMIHSSQETSEKVQQSYSCFLCWLGFTHINDLYRHYNKNVHQLKVAQQNVFRILDQTDHQAEELSPKSVGHIENSHIRQIQLHDYIVLDEVGECDVGTTEEPRPQNVSMEPFSRPIPTTTSNRYQSAKQMKRKMLRQRAAAAKKIKKI